MDHLDFSTIEKEFEEAVEIRKELNDIHWKDYEALKVTFAALFGEDAKALKLVSDMNYYTGGYPSESSPPKIDVLLGNVGTVARYFNLVGRLEEMNRILGGYGFRLERLSGADDPKMSSDALDSSKKVKKAMNRAYETFGFNADGKSPREMVEWFLDQTHGLQHTICTMADEIKIDIFDSVEKKLEKKLDKSGFNTTVNAVANRRLREERQKDTNPVTAKALEKSEVLENNGDFLRTKVTEEVKG